MLEILKKWFQGMLELTVLFPIVLIIGKIIAPGNYLWFWMLTLPVYYLPGILVRSLVGEKRRIFQLITGILITFACARLIGYYMGIITIDINSIVMMPLGMLLFYRGIRFVEVEWNKLFAPTAFFLSLGFYLVGYFFYSKAVPLKEHIPILGVMGFVSMVITLLRLNIIQLKSITSSKEGSTAMPAAMSKNNRIFIGVVFCIILLVACFKQLTQLFGLLITNILYLLIKIINVFSVPMTKVKKPEAGNDDPILQQIFSIDQKESSWIFMLIIKIVSVIILIVLAILVTYKMIGYIRKGILWIIDVIKRILKIGNQANDFSIGYVDEKELLMDWSRLGKKYTDSLKDWFSKITEKEPKWKDLKNNGERIRFLYRNYIYKFIAKGYKFNKHCTPDETSKDLLQWNRQGTLDVEEITDVYVSHRYGQKDIDDKTIHNLKYKLDKIKDS